MPGFVLCSSSSADAVAVILLSPQHATGVPDRGFSVDAAMSGLLIMPIPTSVRCRFLCQCLQFAVRLCQDTHAEDDT